MSLPELKITGQPDRADIQFLDDQITLYNFETTGITDGLELAIFVRGETGEIRAGIYGWTWGGACEIAFLWVHQALRGKGLGSRLLQAAEQEARARGCAQIVLDTHSFQAPEFYKRFGYEIAGQIDNYPRGFQQIFMRKPLIAQVKVDADRAESR